MISHLFSAWLVSLPTLLKAWVGLTVHTVAFIYDAHVILSRRFTKSDLLNEKR